MSDVIIRGSSEKSTRIDASGGPTASVYAGRDFARGELIVRLQGRERTFAGAAWDLLRGRIHGDDILQIGRKRYLDLDATGMRFNHRCEPNAALRKDCELIALTDIARGAEITYDYSMTVKPSFHSWFWKMRCSCGAQTCRLRIGDVSTVSAARLNWYRAHDALQDHIADTTSTRFWQLVGQPLGWLADAARLFARGFGGWWTAYPRALATDNSTRPEIKDHSFLLPGGRTGVLLLHGLSGTPNEMREIAEGLAAKGNTVQCPQLAGHCGGYDDLKYSTWEEWAATAEQALADLKLRCDTVFVGGLSTGAVLSLHLAEKMPESVQGVMLYAPTLWLNGWVVPPHAYLFKLVTQKWVANQFDFPDMPPHGIKDLEIRTRVAAAIHSGDGTIAGLPVTPGGAVLEHRWLVQSVLRRLKLVTQPVFIVHPREDDYADFNNIERLLRHLPCRVETLTLEDSYHIVTSDRQKDRVIAHSLDFMARTEAELEPRARARLVSSTARG